MDGYWLPASAAALVGACALLLLVALVLRGRGRAARPRVAVGSAGDPGPVADGLSDGAPGPGVAPGAGEVAPLTDALGQPYRAEWLPAVTSCVLSLSRARRAVDAVSSREARGILHTVLRRMDAELPNVRVLAELGTSLQQARPVDDAAVQRVRMQLREAVHRYASFAEQLLGVVEELVSEPDLDRTKEHVEALRRQFPLLRPMSELLGGDRPPALAPG